LSKFQVIDGLLLNAAICLAPFRTNSKGLEIQFAANFIGHFDLTARLLTSVLRSRAGRVVSVSALPDKEAYIDFDHGFMNNPATFGTMAAYGQSKLAGVIFAFELNRRLKMINSSAIALAAHPGAA